MKALSIKQPWANLIADGKKGVEIRTWATKYEGPLYIHTGKTVDKQGVHYFPAVSTQPRGVLLATAYLTMCVHYDSISYITDKDIHLNPVDWFKDGLFGWLLVDVEKLKNPVPYKGQLGLFEVSEVIKG